MKFAFKMKKIKSASKHKKNRCKRRKMGKKC